MNNGDKPAFPTQEMPQPENQDGTWNQEWNPLDPGLTKREFFAGQAMQGMLANTDMDVDFDEMAELSYKQADAMLAERPRTEEKKS